MLGIDSVPGPGLPEVSERVIAGLSRAAQKVNLGFGRGCAGRLHSIVLGSLLIGQYIALID